MADLSYYAGKITECLRLLEGSSDPLYRDVYQAMADEFAEKYELVKRRVLEDSGRAELPASALPIPSAGPPRAPEACLVAAPDDAGWRA